MKILLIRPRADVMNIDSYNSQEIGLATALSELGNECDIVYFTEEREVKEQIVKTGGNEVKIFWTPALHIAGNAIFKGLRRKLGEYDIIQSEEYDQLYTIYLAFFSHYRNKVFIYHGPYLNGYNKKYEAKTKVIDLFPIANKAKAKIDVFAKSNLAASFLEERGYRNVHVTGVGLDFGKFEFVEEESKEVKQLIDRLQANDSFIAVAIGKIEDRKNTLFLIELAHNIVKDIPDFKLLLIGKGEANYLIKCQDLISKYNLNENVIMIDSIKQSQLPNIYKVADIYLMPSKYEIFGMVMLEGMYFRVPVLTTNNGGSSTAIDNDKNGYIRELDNQQWVDVITMLYKDKKLAQEIGNNAHSTVIERFSWKNIAEEMNEKYKEKTTRKS